MTTVKLSMKRLIGALFVALVGFVLAAHGTALGACYSAYCDPGAPGVYGNVCHCRGAGTTWAACNTTNCIPLTAICANGTCESDTTSCFNYCLATYGGTWDGACTDQNSYQVKGLTTGACTGVLTLSVGGSPITSGSYVSALTYVNYTATPDPGCEFGGMTFLGLPGPQPTTSASSLVYVQHCHATLTATFNVSPAPTVSSVSASTANGSYNAGDTVNVTVTFSSAVNVVGGPPQLTLNTGAVVDYSSGSGGTTLTFTYTVAAGHTSADLNYISTAALALNGGTIKNTAGTYDAILTLPALGAANSLGGSKAIVIDTTAPMLAEVTAVPAMTNDTTPNYTFSSTEAGTITYTGDCSSATTAASSGSNTVTFSTLIAGAHSNCIISVTDGAGNVSADLTVSSFTIDTTPPTVTINQAGAQTDPATTTSPINFTVVFSESTTNFITGDVTLTGTAGATIGDVTGSGTTYNVAVSGMASAGTVIAGIASGKATDAAGNGNTASASTDNSVTYSPPPASVSSINRAVADPTKATSVTFTVIFTESMSGIDIGDFALALTGTATGTIASVSAASGITVTVTVNFVTGDGTLGLNLNDNDSIKNVLNVPLGGAGVDGSFTGQIYTVDNTAPTVVLTSIATDPTGGSPFSVTATFSESVTGFVSGDVSVTNGSVTSLTGSGTTYTIAVTPAANGLVTVNVAANAAQDSAGNNSTAATALTRTYDSSLVPGYSSTPVSGSTITVGMATVGSSVSTALQVIETGNATLNVASHVLGGTNPLDFSVTPATLSIGNGTSPQNLTIQCTPSAVGLRTATLTVNHDAGAAAAYTLECTGATPASGAGVGSTDSTSVTISFTPGSGSSRIVVFYPTAGGAGFTPADGTGYTATAFGTGAVAPGTYVVYDGSGSSFTVTGLTAGTSYSYAVYEYNGSGGTATYLTGSALTGTVSTTGGGTAATGITLIDLLK